eukprot:gene9804-9962_t
MWQLAVLSYPENGVQNGGNDGLAIVAACNAAGAAGQLQVLQFLCYEGAATAANGPAAGMTCIDIGVSESDGTPVTGSLQLQGTGNRYNNFTWAPAASNSFGALNAQQVLSNPLLGNGTAPPPTNNTGNNGTRPPSTNTTANITCGRTSGLTAIAAIQGESTAVNSASPLINKSISAKGVVTVTRFGPNTRNGFYMSDVSPDSNPLTSDNIFVFVGGFSLPFTVQVGDEVLVSGRVSENGGNTNIAISAITRCNTGLNVSNFVLPLELLPTSGNISTALEPLEGARIGITASDLRVASTNHLGVSGEFWASAGTLIQPTQVVMPGPAAISMQKSQAYVTIGDGLTNRNPDPVLLPPPKLLLNNTLRVGYTVGSGLQGVVVQISTSTAPYYVIEPVSNTAVQVSDVTNPRPWTPAPLSSGANARVIATNVLNLFLGPPWPAGRGAKTAKEFRRQIDKIKNGIAAMSGYVVGVIEIANDGFDASSTGVSFYNANSYL